MEKIVPMKICTPMHISLPEFFIKNTYLFALRVNSLGIGIHDIIIEAVAGKGSVCDTDSRKYIFTVYVIPVCS